MQPDSRAAATDTEPLRARLVAAGIHAPRAEAVVVDLANDAPLAAGAHAIAVEEADRVLDGLGAAMTVSRAGRGVVAVRDAPAHEAIEKARAARAADAVTVEQVGAVYPSLGVGRDLAGAYAWVLDGEAVLDLEAAAFSRARAPRRVTVAGIVARPGVYGHTAPRTVEELVAAAGGVPGGALAEAWVALDGGAYGGALAARDDLVRSPLLLVLPAAHALAARARVPVADWLRRAASACEGCRACTDSCPVALDGGALAPDLILRALVAGDDRGAHLAGAPSCIGCGVCDAACPSALSPFTLVAAVRARWPRDTATLTAPTASPSFVLAAAPAHPDRALRRMSIDLLLARAGLDAAGRDL